jgi:hypothetical protein
MTIFHARGITFENIEFDCENRITTCANMAGTQIRFQNCVFKNTTVSSLQYLHSVPDPIPCVVQQCRFITESPNTQGVNIIATASNQTPPILLVTDNIFQGPFLNGVRVASPIGGLRIEGNRFVGSLTGILFDQIQSGDAADLAVPIPINSSIQRNTFSNVGVGIKWNVLPNGASSRLQVQNNLFDNVPNYTSSSLVMASCFTPYLWHTQMMPTQISSNETAYFRGELVLTERQAELPMSLEYLSHGDCQFFINGVGLVMPPSPPAKLTKLVNIVNQLRPGKNVLAVKVTSKVGVPATGFQAALLSKGEPIFSTATPWKATTIELPQWPAFDFDDKNWSPTVPVLQADGKPYLGVSISLAKLEAQFPGYAKVFNIGMNGQIDTRGVDGLPSMNLQPVTMNLIRDPADDAKYLRTLDPKIEFGAPAPKPKTP